MNLDKITADSLLRAENAQLRRTCQHLLAELQESDQRGMVMTRILSSLVHQRGGDVTVTAAELEDAEAACLFRFQLTPETRDGDRLDWHCVLAKADENRGKIIMAE